MPETGFVFVFVAVVIEPESDPVSDPPILLVGDVVLVFVPVSPIEGVPYPGMQEGSSGAHSLMTLLPPKSWIGDPDSKRTTASPARATTMTI
jgi:hypothetical protein